MGFATSTHVVWPVTPDWSNGVQESLAWLTDITTAAVGGVSTHNALRDAPRRTFTIEVLAKHQERRVTDMLLAGYTRRWQVPVWPDVQLLQQPVTVGAEAIACRTEGFDFVAGGLVLLWASVNRWEVVQVQSVQLAGLVLDAAALQAFAPGDRVYPLRAARIVEDPQETLRNDETGKRTITFVVDEACDWPVLTGLATYLGHPVLEQRPDESEDPTASNGRSLVAVEMDTGPVDYADLVGVPLKAVKHTWKLFGRLEHTWFRSLLYTLRGRSTPMWMPSWTADLRVALDIAADATAVTIEWAGYTRFGAQQPNRRDLRIELFTGEVFYRRITASAEAGGDREVLALSAALGIAAPATRIRVVSFMALSVLASDQVEIQHATDADGVATSAIAWAGVVPDV